jgi:hypothetical protein
MIRDALSYVNELGVLYKRSGKYKTIFDGACNVYDSPQTIKPICPTRWLCRVRSITSVIDQYGAVLSSLEDLSASHGETAAKANGLLNSFRSAVTLLGLKTALKLFGPLEELNRCLQSSSATLSGMLEAVDTVKTALINLRTEDVFHDIFEEVCSICELYTMEPVSLPRLRQPPRRFTGAATAHVPQTAEEYYRAAFFSAVDTAVCQLTDRLDKKSPSLRTYLSMEQMLVSGQINVSVCQAYPDIDQTSLSIQLQMFNSKFHAKSLFEAQTIFQTMVPEVRELFTAVEQLVRLLLIYPVTSCAAERSFSALRRLKNWLRSTMSQGRLNAVTVCHINQTILDNLNLRQLAHEFAERSEIRKCLFGSAPF